MLVVVVVVGGGSIMMAKQAVVGNNLQLGEPRSHDKDGLLGPHLLQPCCLEHGAEVVVGVAVRPVHDDHRNLGVGVGHPKRL
jgi:hypothetical protein